MESMLTSDPSSEARTRSTLAVLLEEYATLKREEESALEALARLQRRTCSLEREIADCRGALARARLGDFPAEILAGIFLLAVAADPTPLPSLRQSPVSVSRVCRRWRLVALDTPRLWSAMTLDFANPPKFDENLWMARMLALSATALASVRIVNSKSRHFRQTVAPFIQRIGHLDLRVRPWDLGTLLGDSAHALHTLVVRHAPRPARFDSTVWQLPSLRKRLEPIIRVSQFTVEVQHLTVLRMSRVNWQLSDFLLVLLSCSALSELDAALIHVEDDQWRSTVEQLRETQVVVPELRSLVLRFQDAFDFRMVFVYLCTPQLRLLDLAFKNIWSTPLDDLGQILTEFNSSSGEHLESLTITIKNMPVSFDNGSLIPPFPALRQLRIHGCEDSAHPLTWLYERQHAYFLPCLEELEVHTDADVETWVAGIMAAARLRGPAMRLSLPGAGPRALRRIVVEQPTNLPSSHRRAVPLEWQHRIAEFAAHGLAISISPYDFDPDAELEEAGPSWPAQLDAASAG
ncbi:hypothetical protein B0H15DRAFT_861581 [Mycena belliarum]|uniref:F-box domain-containing protein n=1 Tax=Mycena belliarum TaxID=1033014 RepID=A0AAD6TXB3_9AGAR|nr:hypothetical protein B0H15DRAFT_861581 [Mycena belliae]